MRTHSVLILIVLSLVLTACGTTQPRLLSESEMSTVIAATVGASFPELNPAIRLPATWTPLPPTATPLPTETPQPTETPLPTNTPLAVFHFTPTQPAWLSPATPTPFFLQITGHGDASTPPFSLPSGRIRISWFYDGDTDEVTRLQAAKMRRDKTVGRLEDWYNQQIEYYQSLLGDSTGRGDEGDVNHNRQVIEGLKNEMHGQVKKVDNKYQEEKKAYTTFFTLKLKWPTAAQPLLLANGTSRSSGSAFYTSEGGDYYFYCIVTAKGDWRLEIRGLP